MRCWKPINIFLAYNGPITVLSLRSQLQGEHKLFLIDPDTYGFFLYSTCHDSIYFSLYVISIGKPINVSEIQNVKEISLSYWIAWSTNKLTSNKLSR